MFLNIEKQDPSKLAMINDKNDTLTYGGLTEFCKEYSTIIPERCLVFILCENTIGSASAFIASVVNRVVPLLLSDSLDRGLIDDLINSYHPSYIWVNSHVAEKFDYERVTEKLGCVLLKTGYSPYEMYDDLSLLLTTSGSTGSPKLVRHSYRNLDATAMNVAQAFELNENDRAIISLPMNFTQGLSTITSCLYSGGTILLTTATLLQKTFWDFIKQQRATAFTGVPYSYELLNRMRFTEMDLPDLRIINEGGGRLTDQMFQKLASYAESNGKKFIATYGSTETTSRMAFLPAELATKKCGSIGRAICNGKIEIIDDNGKVINTPNDLGEIKYIGANVTLGYSECMEDLKKGDERNGEYCTGDIAYFDEDGCIFIKGRKKRFLKLFGYRIGLDETERLLKTEYGNEFACVGTDKKMVIYTTCLVSPSEIKMFLQSKTDINAVAFEVRHIEAIPKNDTGKIQYSALESV